MSESRLKMGVVQPEAYKAMAALEKYLSATSIDPRHKELIKVRASIINGCAYCVDKHSKDALKLGESVQRLMLVGVWREARNLFTEEEQTIFLLTEEITNIQHGGLSDETYRKSIALFGEPKTAEMMMAIITINAWNRIGVATEMHPQ